MSKKQKNSNKMYVPNHDIDTTTEFWKVGASLDDPDFARRQPRAYKIMVKLAHKLYKLTKKYGFLYARIWYVADYGDSTLNICAKQYDQTVIDSYRFVPLVEEPKLCRQ